MPKPDLPPWSDELIALYESNATNQFILHGNITDQYILPLKDGPRLGNLTDYLVEVLLQSFDVVLSYDLGNGIRVLKGGETLMEWPSYKERQPFSKRPREALEILTHYFRYCANLRQAGGQNIKVTVILKSSHLIVPNLGTAVNNDVHAMALLIREWASETSLTEHPFACFLLTENLNDLHALVVHHPRSAHLKVPLPDNEDLEAYFRLKGDQFPIALKPYEKDMSEPARQMTGATLSAVSGLLKQQEYLKKTIQPLDLSEFKKSLVEKECAGLIEFVEPSRTLDDFHGQEPIKKWVRQDIKLWQKGDHQAMPMGYLVCGPVGTGKTYMVECLAGEAGVPVVKLKNFRDKWVGSTESNLEKIFRLLQALGRCVVFIDEADQAMGKRSGQSGDSCGVSGRVYSMMATEMSRSSNRGKILWILASSRPDLIEVDLKRPGRVDVKIPLFPEHTPEGAYGLIRILCKKYGFGLPKEMPRDLLGAIPDLVTPGAAESLAVKVYRQVKTQELEPIDALRDLLEDYQSPVPEKIMAFQIQLAVDEASDLSFVPQKFMS